MTPWTVLVAERGVSWGDSRLPERFWKRVHPVPFSGCWLWVGTNRRGYARMSIGGKDRSVMRWALPILGRTVMAEQVLRHTCDVVECVNPAHLIVGTQDENIRDRDERGRHAARRVTHCPRGHSYEEHGSRRGHSRYCKKCSRDTARAAYRAIRARAKEAARV